MKNNKNIHVLPTDKPSRLKQNKITKKYSLVTKGIDLTMYTTQNIYITSDEEIKEGNWYIINGFKKANKITSTTEMLIVKDIARKITLTTDVDLIKDGVQAIDDDFLEWFVNNPSYESVEVQDMSMQYHDEGYYEYKIIIPKEEPKQETLEEYTSQDFLNEVCWNNPKQETLEEAAEKLTKDFPHYSVRDNMDDSDIKEWFLEALQKGVKWQQEQDKNKFSEEDMKEAFKNGAFKWRMHSGGKCFEEWFEQFKKK